jgi:hypothetical protein
VLTWTSSASAKPAPQPIHSKLAIAIHRGSETQHVHRFMALPY